MEKKTYDITYIKETMIGLLLKLYKLELDEEFELCIETRNKINAYKFVFKYSIIKQMKLSEEDAIKFLDEYLKKMDLMVRNKIV